jgi:hypothetical protein
MDFGKCGTDWIFLHGTCTPGKEAVSERHALASAKSGSIEGHVLASAKPLT